MKAFNATIINTEVNTEDGLESTIFKYDNHRLGYDYGVIYKDLDADEVLPTTDLTNDYNQALELAKGFVAECTEEVVYDDETRVTRVIITRKGGPCNG